MRFLQFGSIVVFYSIFVLLATYLRFIISTIKLMILSSECRSFSNHPKKIIYFSISDSNKISIIPAALNQQTNDHDHHHNNNNNNNYLQLLQQREEENRQEVAKLTSEIRALKVQLIQLRSMSQIVY